MMQAELAAPAKAQIRKTERVTWYRSCIAEIRR